MAVLPKGPSKKSKYTKTSLGDINYWLDWVEAGLTTDDAKMPGLMPLPSQPTSFQVTEHFSTTVERTMGINPYREHNYNWRWDITITGRIGVEMRMYTKPHPMLPIEILDTFKRYLKEYQEGATENGAVWLANTSESSLNGDAYFNYQKVYLILHATKENEHFAVEPITFDYQRDAATSRQSAIWTLTLRGWARMADVHWGTKGYFGFPHDKPSYNKEYPDAIQALIDKDSPKASELAPFQLTVEDKISIGFSRGAILQEQAANAQDTLKKYKNYAQAAHAGSGAAVLWAERSVGIAQGWLQTADNKLKQAQIASLAFVRAANAYRTALNEAVDRLRMPLRILGNLQLAADIFADATESALDQVGETFAQYGALLDMLATARAASADAAAMYGAAGGNPSFQTANLPMTSPNTGSMFIPAAQASGMPWMVPAGVSSWAQIAYTLYGDSGIGVSLAKLNSAKDGYSDSSGKPLMPGSVVLVPTDGITGQPTLESLMLVDLLLDPATGDLRSEQPEYQIGTGTDLSSAVTTGADLAQSRGYANLVQAIRYRATTRRGAVPSLPAYGLLRASIAEPLTEQLVVATKAEIPSQLMQDLRVQDVQSVEVVADGDQMLVEFHVLPVGAQDTIAVVAPLSGS